MTPVEAKHLETKHQQQTVKLKKQRQAKGLTATDFSKASGSKFQVRDLRELRLLWENSS